MDEGQYEEFQELRKRIAKLRGASGWLKYHPNPLLYDEFILTLESVEFHLDRMEIPEATRELIKAAQTVHGQI